MNEGSGITLGYTLGEYRLDYLTNLILDRQSALQRPEHDPPHDLHLDNPFNFCASTIRALAIDRLAATLLPDPFQETRLLEPGASPSGSC